ncbi:MAG: DUF1330 domain-containing protein [Pseudomonadota bacterium]
MTDHFIDPDREAFRQFAKMQVDGPIHMLNLIKLLDTAAYEDGREATGAEAYAAYGQESSPIMTGVGGKIAWRGKPNFPLVGPSNETWDIGFLAEYPSKDAFIAMVKDPTYQSIVYHRQAAVLNSRLYCFSPLDVGTNFAG